MIKNKISYHSLLKGQAEKNRQIKKQFQFLQ